MVFFLAKSGFLVEQIVVSSVNELREQAIEIYEREGTQTFIIFGTDSELNELSKLSFSPDQRKSILPAQNSLGMRILGSKVGLYEHLKQFDIPHPRTEIARNSAELTEISNELSFPIFIKADIGSGGKTVKRFSSQKQLQEESIDQNWFPIVVQEEVKSKEVSVEAAYFKGQLLFWIYSEVLETESEFAASITRKYLEPEDKKFVEILTKLGKSAGLHGFVNSSFLIGRGNEYLLIEADVRPNAWHHLYFQFGIDLHSLVDHARQGENVITQFPKNFPTEGLKIGNKTRHIFKALAAKKFFRILLIAVDSSFFHKKNWAKTADSDQIQVLVLIKILTYAFAVICLKVFPRKLKNGLRKNQFSARILGKLLS